MSISRQRACLVCRDGDNILCIELEDPVTGKRFWSVPGGEVEPGEDPLSAAERETLEETGYAAVADPASELVTTYDFRWSGAVYACETHWFRGTLREQAPRPVRDASYLVSCDWLPVSRLSALLADHPPIRDGVLAATGVAATGVAATVLR